MKSFTLSSLARKLLSRGKSIRGLRRKKRKETHRGLHIEQLDERVVLAAVPGVFAPGEMVQSGFTAAELAQTLVGPGVAISNAKFTGGTTASGSFVFSDPKVVGFDQGIILSSGNVADVVGPNAADYTSTDYTNPGDADLTALSGFDTHDAAVLEFDFTPTANQVVFNYSFASDEYPEWVYTPYNDVFAFYVNGTNYATVRQTAGDPNSPFVPVAVNNINDGNPLDPSSIPARPDLFRPNYVDPNGGPSAINLELDGITRVLTFQAPVNPGIVNHMKLAIADASDGIYDSAVFIQAGSLVSNENPVADLSLLPQSAADPSKVTAVVEAEDPHGLALTYTIDWGDSTTTSGSLLSPTNSNEKTTTVDHFYATGGDYIVTLILSNGSLSGTSTEDVHIGGSGGGGNPAAAPVVLSNPADQAVFDGDMFTFTASASGNPSPSIQWQVSTDSGSTFVDLAGATQSTYTAIAILADNGSLYQAVFTNGEGDAVTTAALLTVSPAIPVDVTAPDAPSVALTQDTGSSATDNITSVGSLALSGIEDGALVEYSIDGGVTWSVDFAATEGQNLVQVRQTDESGNVSDAALLDFLLDTQAPLPIDVSLVQDTGKSATDKLTSNGALALGGVEADAVLEYSTDGGQTWSKSFLASEGLNTVQVRQTDWAGNVSDAALLDFLLDTQAPLSVNVALVQDTGNFATDKLTSNGALALGGVEADAVLEYSTDGGQTWSNSFQASEGLDTVQVRQTDAAGNVSGETSISFNLDTTAPAAPGVALAQDTGISAVDNITKVGTLTVTGTEAGARLEYSGDNGVTWSSDFTAQEGLNKVSVRQTDGASNMSALAVLNFTLDTTAPQVNPTFSNGSQPILVNAKGLTVSPNATDASGIALQSAGVMNTATAGKKSLICAATDLAGNSTSVTVWYTVGYAPLTVPAQAIAPYKVGSTISVWFQLKDANGLISDTAAANLASKIAISFDNQKNHLFSLGFKPSNPTVGAHTLGIHVVVDGNDVTTVLIPIKLV
jgi:hypothetical protein